jgi:hypothetical protein
MEANLAIITGCVPSLGPLVRRIAPGILGSTGNYPSHPTPSGYVQQNGEGKEGKDSQVALETFSAGTPGWKGSRSQVEVEAWSSDENILPPGPEQIRRAVNVDVTFSDASSLDGRKVQGKPAF